MSGTGTIRFCSDCNNILYPRENRAIRKLEYYCKICPFVDKQVTTSCVFVNEIVKDVSTRLDVILSDVNKDPTLQRSKEVECASCGHQEAVFFQAEQHAKSTALNLIFVCCECGNKWMEQNEGEE